MSASKQLPNQMTLLMFFFMKWSMGEIIWGDSLCWMDIEICPLLLVYNYLRMIDLFLLGV